MADNGLSLNSLEANDLLALATKIIRPIVGKDFGDDVEDLAMSCIEKFLTQDPRPDNPQAWITTVAKNEALGHIRKEHRRGKILGGHDRVELDKEIDLEKSQNRAKFGEAIAKHMHTSAIAISNEFAARLFEKLSEKERRIMLLRYELDWPAEKIAEEMNYASAAVVKQTISRIKAKLEAIPEIASVLNLKRLEAK